MKKNDIYQILGIVLLLFVVGGGTMYLFTFSTFWGWAYFLTWFAVGIDVTFIGFLPSLWNKRK